VPGTNIRAVITGWPLCAAAIILMTHGSVSRAAPGQIAAGRYLAQAGDCMSCHTAPHGRPFAGGRYLPTPFGELPVPNITPDRETGIGAWTDDEFYRALHEGIGRQGEYLYPAFPFPWYTKITRSDAMAIKAYLFSVPPVHARALPNKLSFPANQRASLAAWRALFFKAGEFQPDPARSAAANRGAYLVTGLGHCGECHSQHNVAGVSRWSGALQGGPIEGWYAPNLTSNDREGLGSWTQQQIAHFLKTGETAHGQIALGPMRQVIDDSLRHLQTADLQAMAAFLKTVPAQQTYVAQVGSAFAGNHPAGAETYLSYCGYCHGLRGEGLPGQISSLANNGAVHAQGADNVLRVVLGGLPAQHGLAPMPAVGAQMTDAQVADAVNYVRNAFGNAAPGTGPGAVARLRAHTETPLNGASASVCPRVADVPVERALQRGNAYAKLKTMTDASMLSVIDALIPEVRNAASTRDALVNDLTDAYCSVLASEQLSATARAEQLGTFATLTYGQLATHNP
jgi:mono/diheme cytochrome c family protein